MSKKILRKIIDKLKSMRKRYTVPYTVPKHTYKNLICSTGFGHSGSGAVLDYLTEFDNTTVLGYYNKDYSGFRKKFNRSSLSEVDFIRCAGGVFDLEYAFNRGNYFLDDFSVELFLSIAEYFYRDGGIYTDKFWDLTNEFINRIVDIKISTPRGFEGLYFLLPRNKEGRYSNLNARIVNKYLKKKHIHYLKDITVEEYQKIAKDYIVSFLNTIESKDFLVLDQVISTSRPETERKLKYLGEFKLICSYRDPRDVYCDGIKSEQNWIPHIPDDFVKWYFKRGAPAYLKEEHPNKLMLRFEDFVLKYDKVSNEINEFAGLDGKNHIHKREYFNPEISKQNIGMYKNYSNQNEINYIYEKLNEYCYEE